MSSVTFDEIRIADLRAIFEALLSGAVVERPEWWGPRTTYDLGGVTVACAASANGPGRLVLGRFAGTQAEALAAVRDAKSISVWVG